MFSLEQRKLKADLVAVVHFHEKCGEDETIISLDPCSERRGGNVEKVATWESEPV